MAEPSAAVRSLYRHAWLGLAAIALFVLGLGGWAATTQIAGAVVAGGTLVLEEGSKKVQHPEGGIVDEIEVRDGDTVEAGQLLLRLDGTTIAANLAVIVAQLSEALAQQARLNAESIGAAAITRPPIEWADPVQFEALLAAQDLLRLSRAATRAGLASQLSEQIAQIEQQIGGLESQRQGVSEQLQSLVAEGGDIDALFAQGLVQASRVNTIKRSLAELRGEEGRITAEIASARTRIAERRTQIAQEADAFQTDVLEQLRTAGQQIAELLQQKIAAEDRLARLEIRAPQSGVIHESIVRTVGGVVAAGETLMLVVPQASRLGIETRVAPIDIDKLSVGQAVAVKLSGFDARTTPELAAEIRSISPDLSHDPASGTAYYLVRLGLTEAELARLPPEHRLVPGMPAESFMQTGDRTVLSYLLEPFAAQLRRAFRED